MRLAGWLVLALLAGAPACKGKKKPEQERTSDPAASGDRPAVPRSPAAEPDLPERLALDCARIVPEPVRAAHFPGFTVEATVEDPIATCLLSDGALRPSVSLFCHRRKRNWNFADELARDPRKTAVDGVGRGAYARNDHVFFYPSKLDCLARVIWPGDPKKGAEVAKALDAHLSKSTVSPPPAP
jgi:hypothetical protein